jgi:lipopolysaccharide transport system ATP-binding protein
MSLELRRATAPWRPLPDFLIIGADESGALTLYHSLCQHPAVCRSVAPEVHFFDVRFTYGRRWYRGQFPTRLRRRAIERRIGMRTLAGEVSPYYLFHPFVPTRAAGVVPDAKLIAVLRNPIERAILRYHLMVQLRKEDRAIEEAVTADQQRLEAGRTFDRHAYDDPNGPARHHTYLERGYYAEQLERWYRCFDPSQLLVLEARDVSEGEGTRRVQDFLGLPADGRVRSIPLELCPHVDTKLWKQLARHFAPHNERLFRLLGVQWEWDGWLTSQNG